MRLEILSYLLDIKETHSITQTADKYFISHQALSKAIRSLEKELQLTLLLRSKQGVSFTPAGERFLAFAQEVTAQKERLDADLACYRAEYAPLTAHTLSVYAIPRYFTPQFLDLLHILQTGRQKFNISLRNATNEEIFSKVNFDSFTIGLAVTYDFQAKESLEDFLAAHNLCYETLETVPLYCCVHKNSPLAKDSVIDGNKAIFVGFNFTSFEPLPSYAEHTYGVDNFELQKKFLRQKNCFGYYSQKEYATFFSKDFVLLTQPLQPLQLLQSPHTLNFIAIYAAEHDPLVDKFITRYKESLLS